MLDPIKVQTCFELQGGVVHQMDSITAVPGTLAALSLHQNGIELVKSSKALDSLISVLTQRSYVKYLQVTLPQQSLCQASFLHLYLSSASSYRGQILCGKYPVFLGTGDTYETHS